MQVVCRAGGFLLGLRDALFSLHLLAYGGRPWRLLAYGGIPRGIAVLPRPGGPCRADEGPPRRLRHNDIPETTAEEERGRKQDDAHI